MKKRIADWMYDFFLKHHTHSWYVSDRFGNQTCSKCQQILPIFKKQSDEKSTKT